MGSYGCVDTQGKSISSCSSGDVSGTTYLRCGDDCFISCNGGLARKSVDTENFIGLISAEECKEVCKLAEGCTGYKYKRTLKQCAIKYNLQDAKAYDTCKGETLLLMIKAR